MRNLTVCFYRHWKHVISYAFDIDGHHSFVLFNRFWRKLNFYQFFTFFRNYTTLRSYSELVLKQLVFTQNLQVISKLNWRGILEDDSLLILKVIANFSKINFWLRLKCVIRVNKFESWRNNVTEECHLKVSLRALQVPSKLLLEFSRNRALESDFKGTTLSNLKSLFLDWKFEHFGKGSFWPFKSEVTLDFTSILYLDWLLNRLIHENISKVYFLLS